MFDFPNSPVVNQSVTAPNGGFFIFDGVKWTNGAGPSPTLYIPISGGTMTGPLTLAANATQPMHAVPLQQINTAISSSNSVTATGSTTPRLVQDRFAEVINVKDFGAKGDGVADDTAAIQAALNAITAAGAAIRFPTGTYLISATLVVPTTGLSPNGTYSGIRLYGDGDGFTRFVTSMPASPFITCAVASGSSMFNLTIEDMLFQTYSVSYSSWHIDIQNVHGFILRRCQLMSQASSPSAIGGVRVRAVGGGSIFYARIQGCTISGGTVVFDTITDSWIQDSILQCINNGTTGARTSSIHLTGATCGDIKITNNHIYAATSGGIFCDATSHSIMVVEGNMFDTNPPNPATAVAISILAGGNCWTISNNIFNSIPASTIQAWDLYDSTISNNAFVGCGTGSGTAPTIVFNATTTGCGHITVANNAARNTSTLGTPLYFIQENAYGANNNTYLANQVDGAGYQASTFNLVPGSQQFAALSVPTIVSLSVPTTGQPNIIISGNWSNVPPGDFFGAEIGYNLSAGLGEMDFVNCNPGAAESFTFYKTTSPTTFAKLASITINGVYSSNALGVGGTGGPTWTTGSAVPASTQPVGSLYSRVSTWAAGATLYVSKGGGAWTAVASV